MDPQDIRTLRLFEEIEKNGAPSQRELARQLNISLGLVNSFVKRLTAKGYLKITTIPKKRIKYILTPKGFAEKSRLTYQYIRLSYNFYREARNKLVRLFQDLEAEKVGQIVFCGVSDLAEIAYLSMQETSINFGGIIDDTAVGERFLNGQVRGLESLFSSGFDKILVTADDPDHQLINKIVKAGVPRDQIIVIE